jgi:hypothetical protein
MIDNVAMALTSPVQVPGSFDHPAFVELDR